MRTRVHADSGISAAAAGNASGRSDSPGIVGMPRAARVIPARKPTAGQDTGLVASIGGVAISVPLPSASETRVAW